MVLEQGDHGRDEEVCKRIAKIGNRKRKGSQGAQEGDRVALAGL